MAYLTYTADDPRNPSASYRAQDDAYRLIEAALAGSAHVRRHAETFLPRYTAETGGEYRRRLASAPWRPEFEDCIRNIAAKPFSKPVSLQGTVSSKITEIAEDVDTLGNNLHVFSAHTFWMGIAFGLQGILVDHTSQQPARTRAEEIASGARPYWVQVPAQSLLALRTEMLGGKTVVTHARIGETVIEPDGAFGERTVDQVRVFEPGRWELWQTDSKNQMRLVDEGRTALSRVPLALFYTGSRLSYGSHPRPPLVDLADMQMELYRALSREDEVLTFAGSPMLTANGMARPPGGETIEIGPKRILFAPNSGTGQTSWDFIQPAADNIRAIGEHIKRIEDDMRRLGLQPLLPRSGDLTATVGALEAAKAHSAVEAWANALQDALEQALLFTSELMGEQPTAEVSVHTDFGVDLDGGADMGELLKARMAGEISRETYWAEMQRRGKLGPQFDPKEEEERLEADMPDAPLPVPIQTVVPPIETR